MSGFDDLLGGIGGNPFPSSHAPRPKPKPKVEKGVQLHGRKTEDGYYIRAADVAALLELNGVLPGVAAKLRKADAS